MKNSRLQHFSPEGLPYVSSLAESVSRDQLKTGQLLELRTENGPVYVCPSRWQRFRLRRAFRYFRAIPPQLLSRRNQQLISKLLRTAIVTPPLPVPSSNVFGVVEKVHSKSPVQITRPVDPKPQAVKTLALTAKPAIPLRPQTENPLRPAALGVPDSGLRPWIVSGATAAACIPLFMAAVYGISMLSSTPQIKDAPLAANPILNLAPKVAQATKALPVLPASVAVKQKHRVAAGSPLPAKQENEITRASAAAAPELRFISELPPGHFAHPVVAKPNLVGEVRLKALIGADGSVKQVTVLSGDPRLAQAGTRAVMRWHYSPHEVLGDPVAVETEIRMSFFGPDAVSIASVADGPASQIK